MADELNSMQIITAEFPSFMVVPEADRQSVVLMAMGISSDVLSGITGASIAAYDRVRKKHKKLIDGLLLKPRAEELFLHYLVMWARRVSAVRMVGSTIKGDMEETNGWLRIMKGLETAGAKQLELVKEMQLNAPQEKISSSVFSSDPNQLTE